MKKEDLEKSNREKMLGIIDRVLDVVPEWLEEELVDAIFKEFNIEEKKGGEDEENNQ